MTISQKGRNLMLVCMDDYDLLIFNIKAKILATRNITTDTTFKKGCRVMSVIGAWGFFSSYPTHPCILVFFTSRMYETGGNVAECLGRRTWNLVITSSSPTQSTSWICYRLSMDQLLNSLLPVWILSRSIHLLYFRPTESTTWFTSNCVSQQESL